MVELEALLDRRFGPFDLLRESMEEELRRRDGEWSAFSAQVDAKIATSLRAEQRLAPDARAIAGLKGQVESELADLEPRFEGAFLAGIERRIWRSAIERPSSLARVRAWIDERRHRRGVRFALATAFAGGLAIALAVADSPRSLGPAGGRGGVGQEGAVEVERVSFEGTVTVMPEDGMTVLWLADASG